MKKRTPMLENFGRVLPRTMHELGPGVEKQYRQHVVLHRWKDLVGEAIARNVQAVDIDHETLWLYSDSAAWRNELQMRQAEILQRVNNCAGERMVKELRFGRRQVPEKVLAMYHLPAAEEEFKDFSREIQQTNLTDAEIQALKKACEAIEDEELRKKIFALRLKQRKFQRLRESKGYHKCMDCNQLCEKEKVRCPSCEEKHRLHIRQEVRKLLTEIPWASYHEIKEDVPECTTYTVNSQRAALVQLWAKQLTLDKADSMEAKRLTMLYKCVPPQRLTEEMVRETLYTLRFDLARMEEFKPIRRYDYIQRGKHLKKKAVQKVGVKDVPASGK